MLNVSRDEFNESEDCMLMELAKDLRQTANLQPDDPPFFDIIYGNFGCTKSKEALRRRYTHLSAHQSQAASTKIECLKTELAAEPTLVNIDLQMAQTMDALDKENFQQFYNTSFLHQYQSSPVKQRVEAAPQHTTEAGELLQAQHSHAVESQEVEMVSIDHELQTVTDFLPTHDAIMVTSTVATSATTIISSLYESNSEESVLPQECREETVSHTEVIAIEDDSVDGIKDSTAAKLARIEAKQLELQREVEHMARNMGVTAPVVLQTLHQCSGIWGVTRRVLNVGERKQTLRELFFSKRDDAILLRYIDRQELNPQLPVQRQWPSTREIYQLCHEDYDPKDDAMRERLQRQHLLDFVCRTEYDEQYWSVQDMMRVRGRELVNQRIRYLIKWELAALERLSEL